MIFDTVNANISFIDLFNIFEIAQLAYCYMKFFSTALYKFGKFYYFGGNVLRFYFVNNYTAGNPFI